MPLTVRVHVPPRDRQVLEAWARSASVRGGLAQRALIVLLAADGIGTSEIVAQTGASKPTVTAWKKRYAVEGLGGLQDRHKPGRPRRTDDAAIVLATLEPPPERLGVTHWSSRLLASELGMSNVKVAETWRQFGLQPWRREPFRFATDPPLAVVPRAVTGLYLNPPDLAVVLCAADERAGNSNNELLAALNAGTVVASTVVPSTGVTDTDATSPFYVRRRHREYLRFLQQVAAACPLAELEVVAVDNYASRRHPEVRAWLARQSRIKPHFIPTHRSWLTMTEIFGGLSEGTRAADLRTAIARVIDSDRGEPFAWTKPAGTFWPCLPAGDEASPADLAELP
jgi:transposase